VVTVAASVDVDRPIEAVYAYVADLRNDKHWWRGVTAAERLSGDGGPGTEYFQDTTLLGVKFPAHLRVLEVEPPTRMIYETIESKTPFVAVYDLEPLSDGRTRFTMTAQVEATGALKVLGPLFAPVLRVLARRYFGALRDAIPPGGAAG
jgi:uncharacterized protein YndB with AHSA1/START domain